MKTIGMVVFGLLFALSAVNLSFAQDSVIPELESRNNQRLVTVCGTVAEIIYMPELANQPTFIYLDKPFPNQVFEIVIWGNTRPRFQNSPEQMFSGKQVCVEGVVVSFMGVPQIIIDEPTQITAVQQGAPRPIG